MSEWISVDDRLPEDNDYESRYLVYAISDVFEPAIRTASYFEEGWTFRFWDKYTVTHWQPLPNPPEE